jgi:radical SAM enzyme (TIGR01210 family)
MMDILSDSFQNIVKQAALRARGASISKRRSKNPTKPSAAWTVPSRIGSVQGTALSIVLSTIGCAHARSDEGGCTMCSYLLDGAGKNPTNDEFLVQFRTALSQLEKQPPPFSVKIYTSGSFLDPDEVPADARIQILADIAQDDRIQEVVLESRPEYVNDQVLAEIRNALGDRTAELGMGLESSSDIVRSICINKNFGFTSFKHSVEASRKYDIGIRAYVLLKPPFMSELSALLDTKKTISDAIDLGATTISLNPVNVQRDTLVEHLWEKGKFRTPWLWSVVDVLKHASLVAQGQANIVCDPVAAGKTRGAHNCGKCDQTTIEAIRMFSLTQDIGLFDSLSCDCKSLWNHVLEHEDVALLAHA